MNVEFFRNIYNQYKELDEKDLYQPCRSAASFGFALLESAEKQLQEATKNWNRQKKVFSLASLQLAGRYLTGTVITPIVLCTIPLTILADSIIGVVECVFVAFRRGNLVDVMSIAHCKFVACPAQQINVLIKPVFLKAILGLLGVAAVALPGKLAKDCLKGFLLGLLIGINLVAWRQIFAYGKTSVKNMSDVWKHPAVNIIPLEPCYEIPTTTGSSIQINLKGISKRIDPNAPLEYNRIKKALFNQEKISIVFFDKLAPKSEWTLKMINERFKEFKNDLDTIIKKEEFKFLVEEATQLFAVITKIKECMQMYTPYIIPTTQRNIKISLTGISPSEDPHATEEYNQIKNGLFFNKHMSQVFFGSFIEQSEWTQKKIDARFRVLSEIVGLDANQDRKEEAEALLSILTEIKLLLEDNIEESDPMFYAKTLSEIRISIDDISKKVPVNAKEKYKKFKQSLLSKNSTLSKIFFDDPTKERWTEKELGKRYKVLSRMCHPDYNKDPDATQVFAVLQEIKTKMEKNCTE